MMMIIIITFKGANPGVYNLQTTPQTRALKWPGCNCVQITCNTSSAHHLQHVVCHVVQRDSSAIKFDRIEIAFILALIYWLKRLTVEGVSRENP